MRRPFPLLAALPPSLRGVVLDFEWSHEALWALDLPVVCVPLAALRRQLALPLWSHAGRPFAVTPAAVGAAPRLYRAHYARTLAADLAHPLDTLWRPGAPPVVLDGVHRLLRAELLGRRAVAVRRLGDEQLATIAARGA